ncbi:MAG: alpha/beta hydrolase [Ilumatobacteraceae bacterium]
MELFGDAELLFGCRHEPADGPIAAGVVVCPPILTDFGANYQREVRLGRRLAATGIAVQRFHPRGMGHSDGAAVDVTLDSLVADARSALNRLREQTGVERVGLLGTRFSGLVAAAVAADDRSGAVPVVLWEPVTDPRRYMRDGLRARAVHALERGAHDGEEPHDELARRGFVDVLGLPVGPGLFNTPADRGLGAGLGDHPRAVLLVQLEERDALRPSYAELVGSWRASGFDVTDVCCPVEESWWYVPDRLAAADDLLDVTSAWLTEQLTARTGGVG